MMQFDVILSPSEIDSLPGRDLSGVICIVFDVLRATSSILTGLSNGARGVIAVRTIEEALDEQKRRPDAILGGERHGDKIPGFDLGNSPLEYDRRVAGKEIITTTTNGTVALRACAGAKEIWAGALLNLEAMEQRLRASGEEGNRVLLVCAGTFRDAALEDLYGAGLLIRRFSDAEWTDAARVAAGVAHFYGEETERALRDAANGRVLCAAGREKDVQFCARKSVLNLVGRVDPDWVLRKQG